MVNPVDHNKDDQYGDERLEGLLWGDDDIIMLGYGDPEEELTDSEGNVIDTIMFDVDAYVYAGDGDDLVDIHG